MTKQSSARSRQSAAAGLSLPWTTAGRRPSRAQALAALQQAFEVGAEILLPLGEQVETAPDLGLGLGELPPGEQRLAQGPMGQGELRFEPDGLAVVVDGFLQSGLVLRGNAERVTGRDPRGVTVEGLLVISDRLFQGLTTERVEGFHAHPGSQSSTSSHRPLASRATPRKWWARAKSGSIRRACR